MSVLTTDNGRLIRKKKRKEKKEGPKKVEKGWSVAHGPMKTGDG